MHTAKLISLRDKSLTQIAFNFPYDLHKVQDFIVLSRILFTKYFIGYNNNNEPTNGEPTHF